MTTGENQIIAWVRPLSNGQFLAQFVAAATASIRAPAARHCNSWSEARRWVVDEASAIDASVSWIDVLDQDKHMQSYPGENIAGILDPCTAEAPRCDLAGFVASAPAAFCDAKRADSSNVGMGNIHLLGHATGCSNESH